MERVADENPLPTRAQIKSIELLRCIVIGLSSYSQKGQRRGSQSRHDFD
jgi:hypothetical protein